MSDDHIAASLPKNKEEKKELQQMDNDKLDTGNADRLVR